jgi:M6 family metalloprotease-like protein
MKKTQTIRRLTLAALVAFVVNISARADVQMNVGGKHLPTTGTVRVLVVFAQFKDDQQDPSNPNWPLNQLPAWSHQLFATEQSTSYPAWTVTDYYFQMSNGRYHVLGDVYPNLVTTMLTSDEYAQSGMDFGSINREILSRIDGDVDFARYDRWGIMRYNGSVFMREGGDGTAEMIMVIFRSIPSKTFGTTTVRTALGYQWSAIALLGYSGQYVSNEGITVKGGFPGSGITVTNGLMYAHAKVVAILAHEYGHYLFEVHHFQTRGGLGLMGGSGPAMNAYERARLGYITLRDITFDQIQELGDYVTTGVAYRILVTPDEFFIVENRQRISIYDGLGERGEEVKPYGKGIYIFHVNGESENNLDVESAAGNWDWTVQKWFPNPWAPSALLPLIVKSAPNPYGQDAFDGFTINGTMYFKDFAPAAGRDTVVWTAASQGSADDAFTVEGNNTFAPWTNPNSNRVNGMPTGIVVRLLHQEGDRIRVWLSVKGLGSVTSVAETGDAPTNEFELQQNYPNPFNPTTTIAFRVPQTLPVRLTVYNLLGQEVATLVDETKQPGQYTAIWQGVNQQGQLVSSGVYLYVLEAGSQRIVRRMNFVK